MSFVVDQVRRIDSQLDRAQLSLVRSTAEAWDASSTSLEHAPTADPIRTSRVQELQALIKSISTTASSKYPLLPLARIQAILRQAHISSTCTTCRVGDYVEIRSSPTYEHELEWLLVAKATAQAYGQILDTILEQTIPLADDILYWDKILGSYRAAGLYSVQTSPLRLWGWGKEVWHDVRARGGALAHGWRQFYGLVRNVIRDRSIADVQRKVVSPLALVRAEARRKQAGLNRMRQLNANALGVLLGEGMISESQAEGFSTPTEIGTMQEARQRWKFSAAKNVALMEIVLQHASDQDLTVDTFDDAVAVATKVDAYCEMDDKEQLATVLKPSIVSQRLQELLTVRLPEYNRSINALAKKNGRPSRIIRYWLPVSILLVSSSTILQILVNRKAEILTWVREFGTTVIDFWSNWVVEPTKKVIGTIRHDESSEVSIMSKRSLEGDRASLERMVVDFARDNPESGFITEAELADIRNKVKEGDLTPVLMAYEKDLQKPFLGAVKGNLIRALLIQIQKTKVDVEVAMGGIDALLKSQELVFGFVGLTPGLLVLIGTFRWLSGVLGNRKGSKKGRQQGQLVRLLRNIDRILTAATPTEFGELFYKDHGLLLCEVHVLRRYAAEVLPGQILRDFLEDMEELVDVRAGVKRQSRVVRRMAWAYTKWF